jgi:integrase
MARVLHKLSDISVKAEKRPGRHSDGGGLYLNVTGTGTKSWLFMWTPKGGKRKEMGLGSYPTVTLAKARARAAECRVDIDEGRNPMAVRDQRPIPTFGECADEFIETIRSEWRNAKHEYQWKQTLGTKCTAIRSKLVSEIGTEEVLKVLRPIWTKQNETASRLRGRIERVLNYAKAKGWLLGENPATWRNNLDGMLPKRQKLTRGHQPAMPYAKVPAFVADLQSREATTARALELTILTASRSGEMIGAKWPEFSLNRGEWVVPAERMKGGKEHVVVLSPRAVAILTDLKATATSEYVFPSPTRRRPTDPDKPLSNMAMRALMRRMGFTHFTVHGFRSAFRDWAGNETEFARELAEEALAHTVGNEVERAYRRALALKKRRVLMDAWADYVLAPPPEDNVVPFTGKQTA